MSFNCTYAFENSTLPASEVATLCSAFDTVAADAASASEALAGSVTWLTEGLNAGYLILSGALVFIMHGGFAMLCAGAIRSKNTMNILLMTVLDAAVSAIAFYLFGYAFAYGGFSPFSAPGTFKAQPNPFIGNSMFALSNFASENPGNTYLNGGQDSIAHWQDWFYQWAFAATATTIPAGCVAERFNFNAYLGYSFFISAWVYPVVVHWVWSLYGWLGYVRFSGLSQLFGAGMIDFAGSGVVHMVGGFSGMWGCILVGPRMGRFDSNGNPVDMPGHSATLVVLGTVLLWFGWYGFNPGSVILIAYPNYAVVAGRAAVCTTLSGAAGGIAGLALSFIRSKAWDLLAVCNGVLCGFVAVTCCCHVIEPWAAIIVGFFASLIFEGTCKLWLKLRIDDPLGAAPMHGVCGAWGLFFTGLLAKEEYIKQFYWREGGVYPYGCFYPQGNTSGLLLASQIIGILVIFAWVAVNMIPFFFVFKFFGMLRISAEEEQAGLDASKHGGSAYNYEGGIKKDDKEKPAPGL
jgi:ammonium transporter, Amt family